VKIELGELNAQDHSLATGVETRLVELHAEINQALATERQSIDAGMRGLRPQTTAIHKEFAETLARLVDQQIATAIATRLQAVEEAMRETVREEIRLSGQGQQIAELRERVEGQDRNLLSLVMALGHSCLEAAGRISPADSPAPPPPPETGGAGGPLTPPEARVEPAADPELPAFARTRPRQPLWRIPIVPSFL